MTKSSWMTGLTHLYHRHPLVSAILVSTPVTGTPRTASLIHLCHRHPLVSVIPGLSDPSEHSCDGNTPNDWSNSLVPLAPIVSTTYAMWHPSWVSVTPGLNDLCYVAPIIGVSDPKYQRPMPLVQRSPMPIASSRELVELETARAIVEVVVGP